MNASIAIRAAGLVHRYGERRALDGLDLEVARGEIFGVLGPNGGGKTTFFRLLSTLIPIQQGELTALGLNVAHQSSLLRRRMGVVFQAPSLDKKLTVRENLTYQARLYGLRSTTLRDRIEQMLHRLALTDRAGDLVETLSGGLRRRVELAKGMLHRPELLILDEPSTGLDPGARRDLWEHLHSLRRDDGVTVLLTTHLLEEADKADRLAIINAGKVVAVGAPDELRATVGGDTISIDTESPDTLAAAVGQRFGCQVTVVGDQVRIEHPDARGMVAQLADAFGPQIRSITLGKPTLEDVFIARTGHRLWSEPAEAEHVQ